MAGTIIYDDRQPHALDADAREDGDRLWISVADLESATGWTLQTRGPVPGRGLRAASSRRSLGRSSRTPGPRRPSPEPTRDRVCATKRTDLGVRSEPGGRTGWRRRRPTSPCRISTDSCTRCRTTAGRRCSSTRGVRTAVAALTPRYGRSSTRRLRDKNIEMISVALDTAGKAAVEERIRPDALDQRPDTLRRLRGWSEEQWAAKAAPSHPCLIDESHELAHQVRHVERADGGVDRRSRTDRAAVRAGRRHRPLPEHGPGLI